MKLLPFFITIISVTLFSCRSLPTGSNIRSGTIRSISNDTVNFYGKKRLYILVGKAKIKETIQFTVIKISTDTSLCKIKKI